MSRFYTFLNTLSEETQIYHRMLSLASSSILRTDAGIAKQLTNVLLQDHYDPNFLIFLFIEQYKRQIMSVHDKTLNSCSEYYEGIIRSLDLSLYNTGKEKEKGQVIIPDIWDRVTILIGLFTPE